MFDYIAKIIEKHGKHMMSVAFFAGFFIDYLTLPEISNPLYPYIGIAYIFGAGIGILAKEWQLHLLSIGRGNRKFMQLTGIFIAFMLGQILSYVFIYYLRSGDLLTSWPLYIFIFLCVLTNEFDFQATVRLVVNTILFFIATTFFIIFNTPLVLKEVSSQIFLKSIFLAIVFNYVFAGIFALSLYSKKLSFKIFLIAIFVPLSIGGLYFSNLLPAVPLTLRSQEFYSYVAKNSSGDYDFTKIENTIPERFLGYTIREQIFTKEPETVYFFSAVLAPAEVKSNIAHSWQKWDEKTKTWKNLEYIEYPIKGGRKDGYRGFTFMRNLGEGDYRVLVMVDKKRVVGEKRFRIIYI